MPVPPAWGGFGRETRSGAAEFDCHGSMPAGAPCRFGRLEGGWRGVADLGRRGAGGATAGCRGLADRGLGRRREVGLGQGVGRGERWGWGAREGTGAREEVRDGPGAGARRGGGAAATMPASDEPHPGHTSRR